MNVHELELPAASVAFQVTSVFPLLNDTPASDVAVVDWYHALGEGGAYQGNAGDQRASAGQFF